MAEISPTPINELTTDSARQKQELIQKSYQDLKSAFESKSPIEVKVADYASGRFKCVYNEIPLSMNKNVYSSKRDVDEDTLKSVVGTAITVVVTDYVEDDLGKRIKISRRAVNEDAQWQQVKVGNIIDGRIVKIINGTGAIIELDNTELEAFAPISQISKANINELDHFLSIGQEVSGKIIEINRERNSIKISLRDMPTPEMKAFFDTHNVGDTIVGKVDAFVNNRAYFTLGPSVSGLVRSSEVIWTRRGIDFADYFDRDKEYELIITVLDRENQKIELSYKQTQPDNWEEVASKYHIGGTYPAKVDYIPPNGRGVRVCIKNEIDAFMPRQRATALYTGNKPNFKVGTEIQIKIFSIDKEQYSISVESAIRQDSQRTTDNSNKSIVMKTTQPNKIRNFTLADLLSEASKKALKQVEK